MQTRRASARVAATTLGDSTQNASNLAPNVVSATPALTADKQAKKRQSHTNGSSRSKVNMKGHAVMTEEVASSPQVSSTREATSGGSLQLDVTTNSLNDVEAASPVQKTASQFVSFMS